MELAGLQKLTLLDYPGHLACTLFLSGCNLRCPYCHNASLVLPERKQPPALTQEALRDFLIRRRGKLEGVCITGGEPTLQPGLPGLIREIRSLGYLVKLDTNGTRPQVLQALLEEGLLDYVAMDIKNSPARYAETCGGISLLPQVEQSVRLLEESTVEHEFRTTVLSPYHTPQDLAAIGHWLRGTKRYFIQAFVDSGDLVGSGSPLTQEQLQQLLLAVRSDIPNAALRGVDTPLGEKENV